MIRNIISMAAVLVFSAAGANATTSNVVSSGAWSNADTWEGGVVPSATSSSYSDITFASSGFQLTIDVGTYAGSVNIGSNTGTIIQLDKNLNLCYASSSLVTKYFIKGDSIASDVTFNGSGTLVFANWNANSVAFSKMFAVINTKVDFWADSNLLGTDAGSITFNNNVKLDNHHMQLHGGWVMTFGENSVLSDGGNFNIDASTLNISENASFKALSASVGGVLNIAGDATFKGVSGNTNLGVGGTLNIASTGSLLVSDTTKKTVIGGKLISAASVNSVNFASDVFLSGKSAWTLNSSNAITTAQATSQGASNFYIGTYSIVSGSEVVSAAEASLTLGADNDFGSLIFVSGSSLAINANGHKINISSIGLYNEGAGYSISLSGLDDFALKIASLDNVSTYEEDGFLKAYDITVSDIDGFTDNAYIVADTVNGGYWINATNAIPESADIAAIFGALALILTLCFKKNNRK